MKKIGLIIIGLTLLFLCSTCKKEHVAPVNQLVKDLFCFKTGSEWTYYDSVSQTIQKMVVTNYETKKMANGSKRKVYNFVECIILGIAMENSRNGMTRLEADEDQDNSLMKEISQIFTPSGEYLHIGCDKNNNFSPIVMYLNNYTINKTTYSDVYVFNSKNDITFYVSKYIGFIRCMKDDKYDLVLIDKNIQQ